MSVVLIKQYRETDNQTVTNKKLQKEFLERDITSVIVPSEMNVEWINNDGLAIIKTYADTMKVLDAAEQLQADLLDVGIDSIILPCNTDVEVVPSPLRDSGINV